MNAQVVASFMYKISNKFREFCFRCVHLTSLDLWACSSASPLFSQQLSRLGTKHLRQLADDF